MPGTEGREEEGVSVYKVSAREEGKVLEVEHNSVNYLMHRSVYLKVIKMVNYILCIFYHDF